MSTGSRSGSPGLRLAIVAAFLLADSGCGQDGGPGPALPPGLTDAMPPAIQKSVVAAWPKVVDACRGFRLHSEDLEVKRATYYPEYARVNVEVEVSESVEIPVRYRGHHCYFEIHMPRGAIVEVAKSPCASVCLGRDVKLEAGDALVLNLY